MSIKKTKRLRNRQRAISIILRLQHWVRDDNRPDAERDTAQTRIEDLMATYQITAKEIDDISSSANAAHEISIKPKTDDHQRLAQGCSALFEGSLFWRPTLKLLTFVGNHQTAVRAKWLMDHIAKQLDIQSPWAKHPDDRVDALVYMMNAVYRPESGEADYYSTAISVVVGRLQGIHQEMTSRRAWWAATHQMASMDVELYQPKEADIVEEQMVSDLLRGGERDSEAAPDPAPEQEPEPKRTPRWSPYAANVGQLIDLPIRVTEQGTLVLDMDAPVPEKRSINVQLPSPSAMGIFGPTLTIGTSIQDRARSSMAVSTMATKNAL